MKYMGSKNRIAKYLLPIILKDRKEGQCYVEPFAGGCNMIDKVDGRRMAGEYNFYLADLWNKLIAGWVPPDYVSEEEWRDVRENMDKKYAPHYIAFVRICCSFGSDWNGGYARNVKKDKPNAEILNRTTKSYCGQSKRNLMKQVVKLKGIFVQACSYEEMTIPDNSIIYCDPPYNGVTGYKNLDDFDSLKFWQWCRDKTQEGNKVYISEYNAPDDFKCIWEKEISTNISVCSIKKATEKLFIFNGS